MAKLYKGSTVKMTPDAAENYGKKWKDVVLVITHIATKSMPAKEFYAKGKPSGYHPGYDDSMKGAPLYDLKVKSTGAELDFSLYDYEVVPA